jgi:hypothetical protein
LDIEHHLNRLKVTKRDPKTLYPITRCSLINHYKVKNMTKQKIMEYIKNRLNDEISLLIVARLDIHHIPNCEWTILEWYFAPTAKLDSINVFVKTIIDGFRLFKTAPIFASTTFSLDAQTIFNNNFI